jgi:hypothetical protein
MKDTTKGEALQSGLADLLLTNLIPFSLTPRLPVNESPVRSTRFRSELVITNAQLDKLLDLPPHPVFLFNSTASVKIGDWIGVSFRELSGFVLLAQMESLTCCRIDHILDGGEKLYMPLDELIVRGRFIRCFEKMGFEHVQLPGAN